MRTYFPPLNHTLRIVRTRMSAHTRTVDIVLPFLLLVTSWRLAYIFLVVRIRFFLICS